MAELDNIKTLPITESKVESPEKEKSVEAEIPKNINKKSPNKAKKKNGKSPTKHKKKGHKKSKVHTYNSAPAKIPSDPSTSDSNEEKSGIPRNTMEKWSSIVPYFAPNWESSSTSSSANQFTLPKIKNIKEVRFDVNQHNTISYSFNNTVYKLPFFEKSIKNYDVQFLKTLCTEAARDSSREASKYYNVAQGFISFYYSIGNENKIKTLKFEELFISGKPIFTKDHLHFKQHHNLVTAMNDIISPKDYQSLSTMPASMRRIPLELLVEKKLRHQVIEGPWSGNSLDSESLFLLTLIKKLPQFLQSIVLENFQKVLKINYALLGISSYRDCCPRCVKLVQGFQNKLRDIILDFHIEQLQVNPDFGTLAITYGHIRHGYQGKAQFATNHIKNGVEELEPNKHKFVFSQSKI